jgi:hypothetical protein
LALPLQQYLQQGATNGRKASLLMTICDTRVGGGLTMAGSRIMRPQNNWAREPQF